MHAFRDWFERRLDRHVAWAGVWTLVLSTLISMLELPLEISPKIGLDPFFAGELLMDDWEDYGVQWFAYAYLGADSFFAVAYTLFFIGLAFRLTPHDLTNGWDRFFTAAVVVSTLILFAADELENVAGLYAMSRDVWALSWPTSIKRLVMLVSLAALAPLLFRWFFAFGEGRTGTNAASMGLRRAMSDILWRNRYNILMLALFAGLVLVMDQSRDVLVAMAQAWHDGQVLGALLVTAGSALALWVFAYTVWMSARILGRLRRDAVGVFFGGRRGAAPNVEAEIFAKWWARLAGIAPLLVLAWLAGFAARDAVRAHAPDSAYVLAVFGWVVVAGALAFIFGRQRQYERPDPDGYYQVTTLLLRAPDAAARRLGELAPRSYRFLGLPAAPITLPLLSIAGMTLVRALELQFPGAPSMSFITICLGMTLWVGVLSVVTQLSILNARPYIAGVLVVVAVLGGFGWTDNHIVWSAIPGARADDGLHTLLAFHALLALVVFAAIALVYWYLWKYPQRRRLVLWGVAAGTALLVAGVLFLADRHGPRTLTDTAAAVSKPAATAPKRATLDDALKLWLTDICAAKACEEKAAPIPVYFVSTEGGGIRAAYWTALVLSQLSRRIPDFDRRTFSISGVSGGAMGAAIYRACRIDAPNDVGGCVSRTGEAHFLGPLLSTWMFEDVLARVIPTYVCRTPGCGIMSRGAWFEQAMEDAWKPMHTPIAETRTAAGKGHMPYLLLNSTWVETGERAIASDLLVRPASFPTARDQLVIMGADLPLSTAAHNAARFPYVNAIGSLHTLPADCPMDKSAAVLKKLPASCGHLADGGYFDNSGGHTTADIMRALTALLARSDDKTLQNAAWLRKNLVPHVIMIRNGVEKEDEPAKDAGAPARSCGAVDPALPRCKGHIRLLTDLVGPAVTALNAVGTGSNGRLAEALLEKEVQALRAGGASAKLGTTGVVDLDLEKTDVLYPLGWYLSPTARTGMHEAACNLVNYSKLCVAGAARCPLEDACP